jgi:hypothetical protein
MMRYAVGDRLLAALAAKGFGTVVFAAHRELRIGPVTFVDYGNREAVGREVTALLVKRASAVTDSAVAGAWFEDGSILAGADDLRAALTGFENTSPTSVVTIVRYRPG